MSDLVERQSSGRQVRGKERERREMTEGERKGQRRKG